MKLDTWKLYPIRRESFPKVIPINIPNKPPIKHNVNDSIKNSTNISFFVAPLPMQLKELLKLFLQLNQE